MSLLAHGLRLQLPERLDAHEDLLVRELEEVVAVRLPAASKHPSRCPSMQSTDASHPPGVPSGPPPLAHMQVRLYTGACYQPINGFLRQLSSVTGDFRKAIVMHPHLTFAATVGHLCDAVRS